MYPGWFHPYRFDPILHKSIQAGNRTQIKGLGNLRSIH